MTHKLLYRVDVDSPIFVAKDERGEALLWRRGEGAAYCEHRFSDAETLVGWIADGSESDSDRDLCPACELGWSVDAAPFAQTDEGPAVRGVRAVPTAAVRRPGDPAHLYVVEQHGAVRRLNVEDGQWDRELFLNLRDELRDGTEELDGASHPRPALKSLEEGGPFADERGLLGLAFHPRDASRLFAVYSRSFLSDAERDELGLNAMRVSQSGPAEYPHVSVLREYRIPPGGGAVEPGPVLLRLGQPEMNHNGGTVAFGPDGMLYVGSGDGGGFNDSHGRLLDPADPASFLGNAQDLGELKPGVRNLFGKILRLDVDGSPSPGKRYRIPPDNLAGEIYAYGFRNPWKFSWTASGRMVVADVGQDTFEKVTFVRPGGNHGWRAYEAETVFDERVRSSVPGVADRVRSSLWYDRRVGGGPIRSPAAAIVGGFQPTLADPYLFADYSGVVMAGPLDERADPTRVDEANVLHRFSTGRIHSFAEHPDPARRDVLFVLVAGPPGKGYRLHAVRRRAGVAARKPGAAPPRSIRIVQTRGLLPGMKPASRLYGKDFRGLSPKQMDDVAMAGIEATKSITSDLRSSSFRSNPPRVHVTVMNRIGEYVTLSLPDAWYGSFDISRQKAYSALAFSSDENATSTRDLGELTQPNGPLWNIGNGQREQGGLVEFPGGIPLYVMSKAGVPAFVGAIGVSGDTVQVDEEIAAAAANDKQTHTIRLWGSFSARK